MGSDALLHVLGKARVCQSVVFIDWACIDQLPRVFFGEPISIVVRLGFRARGSNMGATGFACWHARRVYVYLGPTEFSIVAVSSQLFY